MVKKWTNEEENKLRENYPILGYKVIDLFPGRTKSSVLRKADWLDLKVLRKRRKELREDRIGYLDIEASQLKADFGIVYSWVIKKQGENKYLSSIIKREEILNGTLDKRVCQELVKALKEFTLIYSFYGTFFDIPFLRTRCLMNKVEFIPRGEIEHRDVYFLARRCLRLHSNRLESVCDALDIKGKTRLEGRYWILANSGNVEALKYIFEHNIADTQILEKVHEVLAQFEYPQRKYM